MDGEIEASVTVSNSGDRAGAEVVQLYIHDLVGSFTRPVRELKGFQKVELEAGESRQVTFSLTAKDLAFYTAKGVWEAEPGEFRVFVGGSSADVEEAGFSLR
jgi:beta-glucosidase